MRGNKSHIILVILWSICLICDIAGAVTGGTPTWFNIVLAHVCLIINNIDLALKER